MAMDLAPPLTDIKSAIGMQDSIQQRPFLQRLAYVYQYPLILDRCDQRPVKPAHPSRAKPSSEQSGGDDQEKAAENYGATRIKTLGQPETALLAIELG
jgi:hypothetical protein